MMPKGYPYGYLKGTMQGHPKDNRLGYLKDTAQERPKGYPPRTTSRDTHRKLGYSEEQRTAAFRVAQ